MTHHIMSSTQRRNALAGIVCGILSAVFYGTNPF